MHHVFAYLDPGSASIIFQAAIAGIIAVPVIFRNKISQMVKSVRGGSSEETTAVADSTAESVAEPTTTDTPAR
jgi:hypothetical protein